MPKRGSVASQVESVGKSEWAKTTDLGRPAASADGEGEAGGMQDGYFEAPRMATQAWKEEGENRDVRQPCGTSIPETGSRKARWKSSEHLRSDAERCLR